MLKEHILHWLAAGTCNCCEIWKFTSLSLAMQPAHFVFFSLFGGTSTSFEEAIPKSFLLGAQIRHMLFIQIACKFSIKFVQEFNNNYYNEFNIFQQDNHFRCTNCCQCRFFKA